MAYIATGSTDTSISAGMWSMDGVSYHRTFQWYINNMYQGDTYSDPYATESGWITFRNLEPGTEYKISCSAYKTNPWTWLKDFNTYESTTGSTKPSTWSWNSQEFNAFNNNGKIDVLTWQRWNDFVERIKEFDKWYNGSNSGQYYLDEAKMTYDDKVLTAYRFNTVRQAIGGMANGGSGIASQNSGDKVYGWYFTQLATKLNSISKNNRSIGTMNDLYDMDLLHMEGKMEDGNRRE